MGGWGEEKVEDEDEDDQEETEVGWHGSEKEGTKKERAREIERGGGGKGYTNEREERERGNEKEDVKSGRAGGRETEREDERSGPHVGDVQYCSNDAEAAPLATIFSLYLLGIHLVLYSGLLHFIPASPPLVPSLLPASASRCTSATLCASCRRRHCVVREFAYQDWVGKQKRRPFHLPSPNSRVRDEDRTLSRLFSFDWWLCRDNETRNTSLLFQIK